MLDVTERVSVLRKYETDCYSICYYLLDCEEAAAEAAKHTLMSLARFDLFFQADAAEAMAMLRKESMKAAVVMASQRRRHERQKMVR